MENEKLVVEGGGATGLAALLEHADIVERLKAAGLLFPYKLCVISVCKVEVPLKNIEKHLRVGEQCNAAFESHLCRNR